MTKSLNPVDYAHNVPVKQLQWALSLHSVVNGNLDMGTPTSKDSTGNYNQFAPGNNNGRLIRIGAAGTTGNDYVWSASAPIVINHGLGRQPVGCHLVSSDKQLTFCQPTTPDENTITLSPSDSTSNATVYVF